MKFPIPIRDDLKGEEILLDPYPDLKITYAEGKNNLCPSNYERTMCVWEGDLELTLIVNNQQVKLNDHDKEPTIIPTSEYTYSFKGIRPLVKDRSREKTYIIIEVSRIEEHAVGKEFTITLPTNASTGYTWEFETTDGLEIVNESHKSSCPSPKPGCGGSLILTLRGNKKGLQELSGFYGQTWNPETISKTTWSFSFV